MILGFAQFGKQSRKLKEHLQKTASKKQWTKHEQSLKKGTEMEPKTMKKPSQKRYVFQGPQKSSPNDIFKGSLRQSRPKSAIFVGFWTPAGPKMDPWDTIFNQKSTKRVTRQMTRSVLEPTWARFSAENVQRTYFYRSGTVFGPFWKDFGRILTKLEWIFSDVSFIAWPGGMREAIE